MHKVRETLTQKNHTFFDQYCHNIITQAISSIALFTTYLT